MMRALRTLCALALLVGVGCSRAPSSTIPIGAASASSSATTATAPARKGPIFASGGVVSGGNGGGGASPFTLTVLTANTTALVNNAYVLNTAGGAFTFTLPASPSTGDWVRWDTVAGAAQSPPTIASNGHNVNGTSSNLVDSQLPYQRWLSVYDGTEWKASASAPSIRKLPTDSNTTVYYTLDETAPPFANTGAGGTASLTIIGTPGYNNASAMFGAAASFAAANNGYATAAGTTVQPAGANVTVSVWFFPRSCSVSNGYGSIVGKEYRNDGTHTSPYTAIAIGLASGGDCSWSYGPAVGGSLSDELTAPWKVVQGVWHLMGWTWDSTNLCVYLDDLSQCTVGAVTGAVDWGPTTGGLNGIYEVGVTHFNTTNTQSPDGFIDDVRIEGVVRSANYFRAMYRLGVGRREFP